MKKKTLLNNIDFVEVDGEPKIMYTPCILSITNDFTTFYTVQKRHSTYVEIIMKEDYGKK